MRPAQLTPFALLGASAGAWLGVVRWGWPIHVLWAALAALLASLLVDAVAAVVALVRRRDDAVRATARLLVSGGLCVAVLGGAVNWLIAIRGGAVLVEEEAVPLGSSAHLVELERGPLANARELALTLALEKVEWVPSGPSFQPRSHLRLLGADGSDQRLSVEPAQSGVAGPLVFMQGAFGFAPRIVVTRGGRTVLDQVVMFRTTADVPGVYRYEGEVEAEAEQLRVTGTIDLSTLDDRMKGHPRLRVALHKGEAALGEGWLTPGHFAEAKDGYRVGLVGLRRWAEIDFSRRNLREVVLLGLACSLAGGLLWAARRSRWARS